MSKLGLKANVWIANIIMCTGAVVTLVDMFRNGGKARLSMVGVGMLFIIAGLVYRMFTVRCPRCGDPLTGRYTLPDTCPRCGHDLKGTNE